MNRGKISKKIILGRRPDWTFGKRKIVIGMLTTSMMNKQTAKHFQACESSLFSLRTRLVSKIEIHADISRKTTGEKTLTR